jgi:hypothetical protein
LKLKTQFGKTDEDVKLLLLLFVLLLRMFLEKSGVNFTNRLRSAFCAYVLGLYFTGARLLAQKLRVERW